MTIMSAQPGFPPASPGKPHLPAFIHSGSSGSLRSDTTTTPANQTSEPASESVDSQSRRQSFSFGAFKLNIMGDKSSDKASSSGGSGETKEKKKLFTNPWKKDRTDPSAVSSTGLKTPTPADAPYFGKPPVESPPATSSALPMTLGPRSDSQTSTPKVTVVTQRQSATYVPSEASRFRESVTSAEATVDRLTTINSALSGMAAIANAATALPFLGESLKFCVQMLDQAKKISLGKVAALRLVERCAAVLAGVDQAVIDNHGRVSPIMIANIERFNGNLRDTAYLLTKLSSRSFLKLYLHADDVARQMDKATHDLQDFISIFSLQTFVEVSAWEQQSVLDHARDLDMLCHKLDEAREDDQAMLRVLSMKSEEQAEAIKTLQRTLDSILAGQQHDFGTTITQPASRTGSPALADSPNMTPHLIQLPVQSRFSNNTPHITVSPTAVQTLVDRGSQVSISTDSGVSWASVGALAGSQASRSSRDTSSLGLSLLPQNPQDPGAAPVWHTVEGHREFCELALNVLRRNSGSSDLVVPDWTITKLEVARDLRISSGFYSVIWRGRWQNMSVAIKELNSMADRTLFIKEVDVWRKLRSPFILPFLGASSTTGPPPWFLVSPYMQNGNVLGYLRSPSGKNASKIELVHHMAQGMEYLHSRDIIHGDLKGANVLVDDVGQAIICDFGLSHLKLDISTRSQDEAESQRAKAGTLRWQSPERLTGGSLTTSCDVYAFAMTVVEVYTGSVPFGHIDDLVVRSKVAGGERPARPKEMPSELWHLVQECWHQEKTKRPRFEKIVLRLSKMHVVPRRDLRQNSTATQASATSSGDSSYHTAGDARTDGEGEQRAISPDDRYLSLPYTESTADSSSSCSLKSIPPHLENQLSFESDRAERHYRHYLQHDFDDRLTVPLWFPTPVPLGTVGYVRHGQFVRLLDATMPPMGYESMPPVPKMDEFEMLQTFKTPVNVRSAAERGIDIVSSWASFIRSNGDRLQQAVSRRMVFPLRPGMKQATLIVDDGQFEIYRSFAEAKAFLQANINWILAEFGEREHIEKQDVMLVVGALTAHNYAMMVSNFAPRTTLTFNVHSKQESGEPWGTWSVRRASETGQGILPEYTAISSTMSIANPSNAGTVNSNAGSIAFDSDQQQLKYSCRVSKVLASPMDAVMLAKVKFAPGASEPRLYP